MPPAKSSKPTISDVAERAGVSKSTVSAVLNNRVPVTDTTRREVLRAMEQLGYRPTPSARRGFQSPATNMLGFVVKEFGNPYYADVLSGIEAVATEQGYLVSVVSSQGDYERERRIVHELSEREYAGLIITPIRNDDTDISHLFELKQFSIPFVLLERVAGIQASLVDVDNVEASASAIRYLIKQGHERIVHFAGPAYSEHSRERIEGVRRAFSETPHAFTNSMIVETGDSLEDGYRAGLQFFSQIGDDVRATAASCYNDLVALGVMKALRELNLDVPGDVAVMGFDGVPLLDYLQAGLSTVRMPTVEMGRRAADWLIRQIEAGGTLPIEKITLDTELVLRGSTGAQ
jgi:LacI family transcriptional regulator